MNTFDQRALPAAADAERRPPASVDQCAAESVRFLAPTNELFDEHWLRAQARLEDRGRRAKARRAALIEQFATRSADNGAEAQSKTKEIAIMNDNPDAIAASRQRINAGVAAFDRVLAEPPVFDIAGIEAPAALLDALSRVAVATAVADLAALADASAARVVAADALDEPPEVGEGDDKITRMPPLS